MKKLQRLLLKLKSNKGSQLIETTAGAIVILIILAICITVLPGFLQYQKLTYFANSMLRTAEIAGTTDIQQRIDQLAYDTKLSPTSISWSGTSHIGDTNRVQLNNKIMLTLKGSYDLKVFGFSTLTVPMTARASGASEVYYK